MFTASSNEAPLTKIFKNNDRKLGGNPPKSRSNIGTKADDIIIGITMGDPSGVGAEVIAKAIGNLRPLKAVKFLLIGDKFVFNKFIKKLPENYRILDLNNVRRANFAFGKISPNLGKASLEYLEIACDLLKNRAIDALVTAPVSKEAISLSGKKFLGHTEYLAKEFKVKNFVMMFAADNLKVSLVTRHIPLNRVARSINARNIYRTILITRKYLKAHFKIKNPKIAVCGINPHAGDGGILGEEEELIIKPAIKRARKKFKNISGPYPSDTIFHSALNGKFDAVIAMYHDQAMIPVKLLNFKNAVNLTLGLPFIRTSPSHGTAFDIAGKNLADESSMVEAIKLACKLVKK